MEWETIGWQQKIVKVVMRGARQHTPFLLNVHCHGKENVGWWVVEAEMGFEFHWICFDQETIKAKICKLFGVCVVEPAVAIVILWLRGGEEDGQMHVFGAQMFGKGTPFLRIPS